MLTVTTVFPLCAVYMSVSLSLLLQPPLCFFPFFTYPFLGCTVLLSHCPCPSHGLVLSMFSWNPGVKRLHAGRGIGFLGLSTCTSKFGNSARAVRGEVWYSCTRIRPGAYVSMDGWADLMLLLQVSKP